MVKYTKLRNMVYEINAKEMYQIKKLKQFFLLRHDVPKISYSDEPIGLLANVPPHEEEAPRIYQSAPREKEKEVDISQVSQKTLSKTKKSVLKT